VKREQIGRQAFIIIIVATIIGKGRRGRREERTFSNKGHASLLSSIECRHGHCPAFRTVAVPLHWPCSHWPCSHGLIPSLLLTARHCTALYCADLHCTALYCTLLYCTALSGVISSSAVGEGKLGGSKPFPWGGTTKKSQVKKSVES